MASRSNKRPARSPPAPAHPGGEGPTGARRGLRLGAGVAVLAGVVLAAWLAFAPRATDPAQPNPPTTAPVAAAAPAATGAAAGTAATPAFLGSDACRDCHAAEHAAWLGSQHHLAMQHATEATVLGDFADATFEFRGVESRFFRRDGRYFVRTDGPDGALADFEIKYTFGVDPLQQYLIEFADGRIQALSIAWDARPAEAGGQRWFHQYPAEPIDHRDELHWTKRAQNWNFMCADCHSTDLRKHYDAGTDSFATAWAAIDVGCEACHGPGADHVAWTATRPPDPTRGLTVALDQRRGATWTIDPATGNAARNPPATRSTELEVCAQCHSRRAQIAEGYHAGRPFLDHYLPALLEQPLYHPDGQQRDEVYVWGSFLQSRMHARGVTCSDCHDPHSQTLRAPGDGVCAQCHLPAKYASAAHHFHAEGQSGSACVDCHMPATDYMVIDPRRDHSFRVPRPDLTVSIGTPNACNACHDDQTAQWADAALQRWIGRAPRGFQQFAETFHEAANGARSAAPALIALAADTAQPGIVRASAAQALAGFPSDAMLAQLRAGLGDADPLVRLGSLRALDAAPPQGYLQSALPLLGDPLRAVRLEAVRLLAGLPREQLAAADRAAFDAAAREFIATQRYNADRPEARAALGSFYAARGQAEEAEAELSAAIGMEPRYVPAYANLADLRRSQGRDDEAESILRKGIAANAEAPGLHHALGLSLVRLGRLPEALAELQRAAELAPENVRFAYVHAVGLNSAGRTDDALAAIDRALQVHPDDRELLLGGALFARDARMSARAMDYARRLAERFPDDPEVMGLLGELDGEPRNR